MAKIKGTVTVFSNSPGRPTGYGQQTEYLVNRMKRDGLDVAVQSNYGVEGMDTEWDTGYGKIPEFARGYELYSTDVVLENHQAWVEKHPDQPDALVTLYDTWVMQNPKFDKFRKILAWTPLDHTTMPPNVYAFLKRENVVPIAMSPFGQKQMSEQGINAVYIPHGIDTKVFKPTYEFDGVPTRKFLDIPEDAFLVMMNSANKANKSIHRKAYAENLLAFKLFREQFPNSFLYIHTEPMGIFGGFNLIRLAQSIGLPKEALLFPRPEDYRRGFTKEQLAALYTAADVTLTTSYGEGFGIATIESQACGTPTITSGFAASQDLAGPDSYLINGQPFWDEAQMAWFSVPIVSSIVEALKQAHEAKTGEKSQQAIDFAKDFDVEKIWVEKWIPLLEKELG
jgi:glycosyltransferase involved in cell wall biosynthesis